MKIRNLKDYCDKVTKEPCKAGKERDVAAKRGREIIAKGFAEEIKESKE